jgi:hypothetical protein
VARIVDREDRAIHSTFSSLGNLSENTLYACWGGGVKGDEVFFEHATQLSEHAGDAVGISFCVAKQAIAGTALICAYDDRIAAWFFGMCDRQTKQCQG